MTKIIYTLTELSNLKRSHWVDSFYTLRVEIETGNSIRLFGIKGNLTTGPRAFDMTFKVGEKAEFDSYNLNYFGEILNITAKGVKFFGHGVNTIIGICEFVARNWDDVEKKIEHNQNWMD